MESRVAETLDIWGTFGPGSSKRGKKSFVGIANPKAGLGREPIEATEPGCRGLQARIVEDFRFVCGALFRVLQAPFVPVPEPGALVAFAFSDQTKTNSLVEQLEDELRGGFVSGDELLPINAILALRFAQMHQQAMAEFADLD